MEVEIEPVFLKPATGTVTIPKTGLLTKVYFDDAEWVFDPPIPVNAGDPVKIAQNDDGSWRAID